MSSNDSYSKTKKVTLKDQVVNDMQTMFDIEDEVLGDRKEVITQDNYYGFLGNILKHTHFCLEYYSFVDDKKEESVKPT